MSNREAAQKDVIPFPGRNEEPAERESPKERLKRTPGAREALEDLVNSARRLHAILGGVVEVREYFTRGDNLCVRVGVGNLYDDDEEDPFCDYPPARS